MKLNINDILFGFSVALDAVEGELIGATSYHAQRVAYLSSLIGRELGLSDYERVCLAVAAVMHDNALTEYTQRKIYESVKKEDINIESDLGAHCAMGETNVTLLPIYHDIKGAVLYHHEKADGTGPFRKKPDDIPLFARIIHLSDRTDVQLDFASISEEKFQRVVSHIESGIGKNYDEEVAGAFLKAVTLEKLEGIGGNNIVSVLYNEIPTITKEYTLDELIKISDMFAKIIDFKSPFTTRHSRGIAEKAKIMAEYYGWGEDICAKMYFAGAVHDVGKLFVDNDILDKPGKLTADEYLKIQDHATGTYVVLNAIRGLGDIVDWASLHHEKLDGSGYPFKKVASDLTKEDRLMACLDIYQALIEPRPYKDGMPHEKAMSILYDMVEKGQLDADITKDIDKRFKDWVEKKA